MHQWLESSGVNKDRTKLSNGRNWIHFNATIAEVEGLLQTEYKVYEHGSGQLHIACDEYSVPKDIQEHIDFIMPTVHFDTKIMDNPELRQKKRDIPTNLKPGNPGNGFLPKKGPTIKGPGPQPDALQPQSTTNCNTQITPECLRALYGLPAGSLAKSSYGIVEYTPQAYLQSDLNLFYSNLATNIPAGTAPTLDSIDGGVDQTTTQNFNTNGESDLDLEYAIALGRSINCADRMSLICFQSIPRKSPFTRLAILSKAHHSTTSSMVSMLRTARQQEAMIRHSKSSIIL